MSKKNKFLDKLKSVFSKKKKSSISEDETEFFEDIVEDEEQTTSFFQDVDENIQEELDAHQEETIDRTDSDFDEFNEETSVFPGPNENDEIHERAHSELTDTQTVAYSNEQKEQLESHEGTDPLYDEESFSEETDEFDEGTDPQEATSLKDRIPQFLTSIFKKSDIEGESKRANSLKDFFGARSKFLDKIKSKSSSDFGKKALGGLKQVAPKDFNAKNILDYFFAPGNRAKIHSIFITGLIIVSAYSIGKISSLFIASNLKPAKTKSFSSLPRLSSNDTEIDQGINLIKRNNIFNIKEDDKEVVTEVKQPKVDPNKICLSATKKSSLDIKLTNTIVLQDSVKSLVSVEIRGEKEPLNLREGDTIKSLAKIGRIERLRLVLKNLSNGDCEYVEAPKKNKSKRIQVLSPARGKAVMAASKNKDIQTDGTKFKIKKTLKDKMLGNINEVLTQAKAITIKNPDGTLCFKMTQVETESIYTSLDIRNNDIICGFDGQKITNLNQILQMFGKIRDIDQIQIDRKRNGVRESIDYEFY